MLGISANAQIVYVDQSATGTGDGSSWANAVTDLQAGIDLAAAAATPASPVLVWVKADTYYPTAGTDRTISFIMKNDVQIYGGFMGNEVNLIDRDWIKNETILSGDIGTKNVNTDNSQVVIHNSNAPSTPLELSAVLDGFIVEDGYMDDASLTGGAGMRNNNSSPTIRNCIFRNNVNAQLANGLTRGGAILAVTESNPLIQSCIFYDNSARSGGAIAFRSTTYHNVESKVINCLFYDNTSHYLGGAIYVENHRVSFYNNTITRNINTGSQGFGWGGAIYYQLNANTSSAQIANNIVWGNTGLAGNAIYVGGSSNFPIYTTNIIDFSVNEPDPEFLDPDNDDFSLNPCLSPAVDAGTSSSVPTGLFSDLSLGSREFNNVVDIGAYEVQGFPVSFSAIETGDVSCNGEDDGQIHVNAGSYFLPIEFSLDNSNYVSSTSFLNLAPGTYTVYARDATGCTDDETVVINEPTMISINTITQTHITCSGEGDGSISISVSGGSTPYQVSFDGGATTASTQFTANTVIDNLDPGTYEITIVDGNGCTHTSSSNILIEEPDVLSATIDVVQISCNGEEDGGISISAVGGTGSLSYSLDGINYQASPQFSGLSPGNYSIFVEDANGCELNDMTTIVEPVEVIASVVTSNASCFGSLNGSITISTTNAISPVTYILNDGVPVSNNVFDQLDPGTYKVEIVDANGCGPILSGIEVGADIVLSLSVTQSDRNFTLEATGGTSPYEYSTDGTNFQSSGSFFDLDPGSYTFMARDANGCMIESEEYDVVLGVKSPEISVYPNPVSDLLKIEGAEFDVVSIVNLMGQELHKSNRVSIPVRRFAKGTYILRLFKDQREIHNQKLIIN